MDSKTKMTLCAVGAGVLLNLILPQVLKPMATEEEKNPPDGAANLSLQSQLMHMFVHHAQVPISSSVIIAIIVALSIVIGRAICEKLD
mgnify:CR=1 FL=1